MYNDIIPTLCLLYLKKRVKSIHYQSESSSFHHRSFKGENLSIETLFITNLIFGK